MKKIDVALLASTGMVGQRYVESLANHPYLNLKCVAGKASAGKKYGDAANWLSNAKIPDRIASMDVVPTEPKYVDADVVFSPLPAEAAKETEPAFAEAGFAVVSDCSANRMYPDVPIMIPDVNPDHAELVNLQKKRRNWSGFIVTTPNCTTVGLAMVLKPLCDKYGVDKAVITTMQALSGAGIPGVPSLMIVDNVLPYIEGEEEKVKREILKILGSFDGSSIHNVDMKVAVSCNRVATIDGHMQTLYFESPKELDPESICEVLSSFRGLPQELKLPTAPENPIIVRREPDRPQPRLDRLSGTVPGMSTVVGRVRQGIDRHSAQLTLLSHNTIRGASGTAILTAELLVAKGLIG